MISGRVSTFTLALPLLIATTLCSNPAVAQVVPIQGGAGRADQMLYAAESLQEYQTLLRSWTAAWSRGNARDVTRLYIDDATLVPTGGTILQGRGEILPAIGDLIAERPNMRVTLLEYEVRGTLFYTLGSYTHQGGSAGSSSGGLASGTVATILQRDGRTWRIRSQIFSPADNDR
jgi:uncharacterized protein (TIGR02246 family)